MLQQMNSQEVRVFVVWEPVLPTDFTAPSTSALGRIPDLRAVQYWDRKRALSHLLAVYAPGALWQDGPPKPVYSDHPVRDVIVGAQDATQRLLNSGTNPAGGEQ
jgi:hypothetical protein